MSDYKTYDKLEENAAYDHVGAEQLAEAMNEARQLKARLLVLEELFHENEDLHTFVWTTADGETIALHNIDDDHLKNIMQHCVNAGRNINKAIRAEARKRGFEIPVRYKTIDYGRLIPNVTIQGERRGSIIDAEITDMEIPF